jgi:uncharacterized membrane protein YidH (DUF202 family)
MNPRDPGLQHERTALAWQRTGLSAAVVGVLLVRTGIVREAPLQIVAGSCLGAVMVLAVLASRTAGSTRSRRWLLLTTTMVLIIAGTLTVADVLLATE